MISADLGLALLVERFGVVPEDEAHAPPRPLVPWTTPDTPTGVAVRRRLLCAALDYRGRGHQERAA